MKQLQQLHEEFIAQANRPMSFGALPVEPREREAPVVAMERWREAGGALHKTYKFRQINNRVAFVMGLLAYEEGVEHHAVITIDHDEVSLKVTTKDIDRVTELDKEYARYADVLFRDLVQRPDV